VSCDDKKTESKVGYPPLVELLRESMQHASLAEQLEVSMEHIVTKLNWASTQLSRAVEQLREVSARASRQSAQPQLAQGSSVPEADGRGRGGGTHALLEALEDQSGVANKRRQCRAMVDVTQKLLLLIDALFCHLHRELLGSSCSVSCSVVLQRLVDSLLHLLSLTAGPNARLFDTRDPATVRRMGGTWHLRPHNLLLPLAAALISLVLPEERQMPRASGGKHSAAEAQREGRQEVESSRKLLCANVMKALVCSPSFDIQRFRELANVRSWVDTSLLSLTPASGGPRLSSESCAATCASAGPNTSTACAQDAVMRLELLLHALLAGLQTWNATYVHLCLSLCPPCLSRPPPVSSIVCSASATSGPQSVQCAHSLPLICVAWWAVVERRWNECPEEQDIPDHFLDPLTWYQSPRLAFHATSERLALWQLSTVADS
jgi:hypothetical protein